MIATAIPVRGLESVSEMGGVGIFALGVALVLLVLQVVSVGLVLFRFLQPRRLRQTRTDPPRATVLRPIHGLEYELEATLASGMTLDYPNFEVLFCVEDEDDPAAILAHRLIKEHPDVDARVLVGRDRVSQNPKLNNLVKGWRAARGAWVVMADSNILLPRDYLWQLLDRWDGRTGLVSSPAAGVDPDGFAGALECAFLNSYQARWQLAADQVGIGFAQGKTLFWKRDFLDAAGGPEALAAEIAEDAASTKLVRRAGLKVRLTQRPFPQPVGRRTWRGVWGRQLRWAIIRKMGFPAVFIAEPLTGAALPMAALVVGVVALGLPGGFIAAYLGAWYGAEWVLARIAGWPARIQDVMANVARDIMIPALWLAAWSKSSFEWQGNKLGDEAEASATNESAR